ncbi:CatB-related O-acetyltransferase [Pukyongiella litopenaei]|uniref:Chloramphenicol acetyltransferase n=1 Tax=Pukyongiella litopenaei TaxID=2605946 RepID=A0A2S0MN58_9RHOB|nr:CatB-related O-acetyltransferase [Pukyongiella litopenaei]AVO37319.1 CatB-related O-acetyltransferase [Pukyongiella litopenaei]
MVKNENAQTKHWSKVELLHETVKNPNIHIRGTHSYYSDTWSGSFEESVVRYLYGDAYSLQAWEPIWPVDQLYIGDYVCFAAECVVLMGGNHTHRMDWFSLYPFPEVWKDAFVGKGDTRIGDGAWIGMRAMIMPGITIGEGAVIASGAIVTKDIEPYTIVGGNPATLIRDRFPAVTISKLLELGIYGWDEAKFTTLRKFIASHDIDALAMASDEYDKND